MIVNTSDDEERRGKQKELSFSGNRAVINYELPLNEVVFDFYDKLKSVSKGYASFDYTISNYQPSDLVKMQVLVNEESVDALAMIVHRSVAENRGRIIIEKLKELSKDIVQEMKIRFTSEYDTANKILTEYLTKYDYLNSDRIIRKC